MKIRDQIILRDVLRFNSDAMKNPRWRCVKQAELLVLIIIVDCYFKTYE